ncbi:DUF551 domain-containing protein [Acinetobacter seifertii]|uniref:DUF551 domain-containing protein n=1 Tax=Acinetobacter seifertii TaxID=1530123 RepID=A0A7H2T2S4_9GAMM|nr:DUF551 domain-containing protein [Acinetobacter seifertii]MBD1220529.1 DUF551 domain-containing protein [Acinetobacter seifertii]MBD1230184.1 DUF551 domain-containing protein [Acinetobacter seifertii]QNX13350.1 DUF551 domain-containing protein [Acinetobacter seifertii]QNX13400.1 DUF551 domain-containing protein [Acinetobacter seifertii]QNX18802.1 DUF551 domain-containing protein [Acinetobacter seifertii]
MEWISVTDRLPEDNEYVDILINGKRRMVDTVFLDNKFYIFPPFAKEQWVEVKNNVTHWMPLPEPPKN